MTDMSTRAQHPLPPGTAVEVRNHFRATWATGFTIAGWDGERVRLRRTSDGAVLPVGLDIGEVRVQR